MTKADKIRSMNDEELIHFLCNLMGDGCGRCPFRTDTNGCTIRHWLSSEHQNCEHEHKENSNEL